MRSAAKSAAFGGVLLAMIEGVGILLTRMTAPPPAPVPMVEMPGPSPAAGKPALGAEAGPSASLATPIPEPAAPGPPEASAAPGGGWFGGWFGGGKKAEAPAAAGPKDLSEERFAPPPMPEFGQGEPQFR